MAKIQAEEKEQKKLGQLRPEYHLNLLLDCTHMARSSFYYPTLGLKSLIRRKKYKSYKAEQGKIARNEYQIR